MEVALWLQAENFGEQHIYMYLWQCCYIYKPQVIPPAANAVAVLSLCIAVG